MISHPLRHWHGVHVSSHCCPSTCPSKSLAPCPGDWFRRVELHSSIAPFKSFPASKAPTTWRMGTWYNSQLSPPHLQASRTTKQTLLHRRSKPVGNLSQPVSTCLDTRQAPPVPSCLPLAQCPRQGFDCCHSSRIAARWCPKKDGITTIHSSCFQVINWIVGDFNCWMWIYIADVAKRYTPSCVPWHQASWQALLADSE